MNINSRARTAVGNHRPGLRVDSSLVTILIVVAAVIVIALIMVGGSFFGLANLSSLSAGAAIPLLVGTAGALGLLAGVVDLSVGAVVGLGAMVFGTLVSTGTDPWLAAAFAVLTGVAVGVVNATAVVGFGAESLVATLGALTAARGLVLVIGNGASVAAFLPGLYEFTSTDILGVNSLFLIAVAFVVLSIVVVTRMRLGSHIRAAGGDERSADRAGIPVGRLRFLLLAVSATTAALGGIFYVGQLGSAPITLGTGLEFEIYAAVMIGGYSITRGGVGHPLGAALGILSISALGKIFDLQSVSSYWQDVIIGLVLVAAIYIDRLRGGEEFR